MSGVELQMVGLAAACGGAFLLCCSLASGSPNTAAEARNHTVPGLVQAQQPVPRQQAHPKGDQRLAHVQAESRARKRRLPLSPASIFDKAALLQAFEHEGIKSVHAKKCWQHLIRRPSDSLDQVPGLPARARALLCGSGVEGVAPRFTRMTSNVHKIQRSVDGTVKLLIRLQDGLDIEAVRIMSQLLRFYCHGSADFGVWSGHHDVRHIYSYSQSRQWSTKSHHAVRQLAGRL